MQGPLDSCLLDNPTLEHMKIPTPTTISSKAIYFPRLKNRPERIVLRRMHPEKGRKWREERIPMPQSSQGTVMWKKAIPWRKTLPVSSPLGSLPESEPDKHRATSVCGGYRGSARSKTEEPLSTPDVLRPCCLI
ncbi:hypothetical protein AVEN_41583-1 [Araneus ventricosus]|uniref:Uncharacterized protein n=1 Tax=Araneus ventricosus TaxID=182803 RepID=A0A4Y2JXR8_ARAVE|nr:hypothetical protein AVEN_41583-1 [Araneus ventricosus]